MVKNYTSLSFALFLSVVGTKSLSANTGLFFRSENLISTMHRDTVKTDKLDSSPKTDTIGQMVKSLQKFRHIRDTVDVRKVSLQPNISLQQIVKGQLAGVYVQEPSGEPGSVQSMIVQGASGVMFTKRDNYALQPAVYLNGVPMVQENPFAFDVQEYDYNRVGPATNLLSQIDISNIQSIAVVKDPFELAKLGPNAANGAIYITTKNARAGVKDISLNAYYGFASNPKVYTTNGAYENTFRKQFFDKYATQQNYDDYAPYLRDSTNAAFFGPSNWNDLYYKNTPTYTADLGITGGNDRANFRFFGSGTKNANSADETSINRYNIFFGINMAPFKWLTVSSNVNAARLDRFGNRSLRDRYAEARYIPDLSTPLSPNAAVYGSYLQEFDKSVDNNRVTTLNGNLTLSAKIDKLTLSTSLLFDYNEGSRDYFTPSTLMDGISYISSYFGYNQRMIWNNAATYKFDFTPKSELQIEAGQTYQEDTYKYNYTRAYDGPSDFVKLNKVSATATGDGFLNSSGFGQVFRYIDKEVNGLFSVYASAKFKYEDFLTFSALVRRDGSSNGQPNSRWVTTPAFDVKYSLKNQFLKSNSTVNSLNITAGWGQTVRTFLDDRYAAGPQYRTENGWDEEPTIPGYGPVLGMNRPYNSGFIGYNIKMPIAERTNINLDGSFFDNRLNASLTAYNRNDKNQLIGVPVSQESGYTQNYKSGLEVGRVPFLYINM